MHLLVYRSSAGSGKTYTLAKDYILLLLRNPSNFRHILAITFTNKAANEMKERILSNLELLSSGKHSNNRAYEALIKVIESECQPKLTREEIEARAKKSLQNILHHYTEFAIGTIDSFMHRVVRAFAFDLHLSHNFEVELDQSIILDKALTLLLQKAGTDPSLTSLMLAYIDFRISEEGSFQLHADLKSFARIFFSEDGMKHFPEIASIGAGRWFEIRQNLADFCRNFEKSLNAEAKKAMMIIHAQGLDEKGFIQGKRGVFGFFSKLSLSDFIKIEPNSYVEKVLQEGEWYTKKTDSHIKAKIDAIQPQLTECLHNIYALIQKDSGHYNLYLQLLKSVLVTAMLNEVFHCIHAVKKEQNMVHISEFNKKISEVVLSEPVPFIYARLGEKYRAFLIDEFQDTSVTQWQNLIPLVSESLTNGEENSFSLIVGDGKQAVYRWRSGEVAQFEALPEIFQMPDKPGFIDAQVAFINQTEIKHLDTNWRSGKSIVDFNNRFFRAASQILDEEHRKVYKDVEQKPAPDAGFSCVEIQLLTDEDTEVTQLEGIVDYIQSVIQKGYMAGEIAILVRTAKHAGKIAAYLLSKNIKVVSADSMKLTASDSVRFLISLMRMLNNPADKVSTAHACIFLNASGFPGFENKVEVLSRIADMGSVFFWKHFPDLPIQKAQLLPLFELCEHLCRAFGLYPQYDVYLQYFIDNVLNYTAKEQSGIEGFLQWWDDNESKLSLDIPETSDAVQIVTIHKSKGLSFRVVICPYVWESKGRKDNFRWYDTKECIPFLPTVYLNPVKNLEKSPIGEQIIAENRKILLDNLNILYVAFTRAEERLMIFTKHLAKDDEHLQNIVNNALMAAFEWDSAEGFFRLGEDVEVSVKEEKEEATEITSCNSYEWTDRLRISGRGEDDLHAHAREFGVVIHETLAKIGRYCTPQKAIQIACLRYPTMANLIRITLENLFDDPRILPFFEATANSYSEFEIITSEKKILRPDKLIIYEHYADVIDFKTGRPSESHHEQLLAYSSHLQKILKKPVNKYLLYVNPEEHLLEKIP